MKAFHSGIYFLAACATLLLTNCNKDSDPSTGNQKGIFSFSNSEYTGIAQAGNHYYPRPVSIRFNSDSTMTTFSYIVLNSTYKVVTGKITQVTTTSDGQTDITVSYALPNEVQFNFPQTYRISADKSTLSGGAFPLYAIVDMKLFPTKAPSIVGTWSSAYADIEMMKFYPDSTTTHIHGGVALYIDVAKTALVTTAYHQDGSRLTFAGINERNNNELLHYYGVLTADGKTIYTDSYDFSLSRLPSFGNSGYGPNGVTPTIKKQ